MMSTREFFGSLWKGFLAGVVALLFLFFLRVGGYAPYPPESALQAFLKIIPASIQEPAVQNLGEGAKVLGLVVASAITLVIYGLFGVAFENLFAPRVTRLGLSRLEKFLLYALIPWLFFGLIVLPIVGDSIFGISSTFASGYVLYLFPISLLFGQALFAIVLYWEYSSKALLPSKRIITQNLMEKEILTGQMTRRNFIEKGVLALGALALLALSFDSILTALGGTPANLNATSGTPVDLQDAPAIFSDPRLATLVDNEVTANSNFYRVAIDLFDPSVDSSSWTLEVTGLVGNPKNYSLSDLQNMSKQVQYTTFECVSNLINGNLISNAKWGGVRISDLLSEAGGLSPTAEYVVFYSVDGYSVGIPVSRAMMSDSMLAYEMNNSSLPQAHGYPLRAVIPGLYGMMSAKWIRKIEVIDSVYSGYWQTRGWENDAVINTVSFITVPGNGANVNLSQNNGSVILAGYAFGGDRGISKVEVSTDRGQTWHTAELKRPLSNLTWALWAYDWHPSSTGSYEIYVRSTDGSAAVQTSNIQPTFPNGATGYAVTSVTVNT